ncbi:HPr-rel-A system PqqD family peptide chaperone [Sulfurimicrobium lacus]|uniref:HPr-rel-A system PqqD family peptide chaperone n=1 Tax=Sulfurimicrobium lacus TaxID=2715678 RepID=UPI0015674AC3|nr:HPr-rel-A system PqqD family peptide chaperone [Sulfurimicrobium lacus]
MMWRLISGHALHFRSWNDEFVVYNSLSGDTHLLGSAAAHVLLKLQQAPADAAVLAEFLAPALQPGFDGDFVLEIEHLLVDLNRLALVELS